jgi:hypothetical protein
MPSMSLALLGLLAAAPSSAPSARLERLWEVRVGPGRDARLAVGVCPNGASIVSDGEGRLVALDAAGKVAFDQRFSELGQVSSLSCDQDRILASAADSFLVHVLARGPGGAVFKGSHRVPLPAHRVAAAPDGGYWILTHGGGPWSQVHKLSVAGQIEFTTPLQDLGVNAHQASIAPVSDGGLLVVSPSQYVVHRVTRTGTVAGVSAVPSPGFTARGPGLASDDVTGIVPLPRGRFATHVSKATYVRPRVFQAGQWLEVLGPDLEIEQAGIRITRGRLVGADANGNLYFASAGRDLQMTVVKARLVDRLRKGDRI